jgi:zinc protease
MQIGMLETIGLSWRELENYHQRIEAVTPEQIRDVARSYLVEDRLTVAELLPQPIDPDRPPRSGAVAHVH